MEQKHAVGYEKVADERLRAEMKTANGINMTATMVLTQAERIKIPDSSSTVSMFHIDVKRRMDSTAICIVKRTRE